MTLKNFLNVFNVYTLFTFADSRSFCAKRTPRFYPRGRVWSYSLAFAYQLQPQLFPQPNPPLQPHPQPVPQPQNTMSTRMIIHQLLQLLFITFSPLRYLSRSFVRLILQNMPPGEMCYKCFCRSGFSAGIPAFPSRCERREQAPALHVFIVITYLTDRLPPKSGLGNGVGHRLR